MIFLFIIILVLSVFSGYYMNKLSDKTSAILKENYLSVVYAREMSEGIMNINQEIMVSFLMKRNSDTSIIAKQFKLINKSLKEEKNNITEPGEDKLVSGIESGYNEFRDTILNYIKSPKQEILLYSQNKSGELYQQLLLLSQINGKALEVKTDDAKATAKSALTQMTILATLCFLIGMSFTFSFASYFNQRFFQLYYGIKEIVSSNYDQRLFFDGKDEFHEISLLLNEMAAKLKENKRKMSVTLLDDHAKNLSTKDVDELKQMLFRIKTIEEQASALISKFENK
jgi:two-component system, NtrC family, sensor histidine kinase KinB